jgi:hypothetical protein
VQQVHPYLALDVALDMPGGTERTDGVREDGRRGVSWRGHIITLRTATPRGIRDPTGLPVDASSS